MTSTQLYFYSYIEEEFMYDSDEVGIISDNSDLDLEPGEIPSTKSHRFSARGRKQVISRRRPIAQVSSINADDYGSSSDDDLDCDSDESID